MRVFRLALQLSFSFDVCAPCLGLVGASPQRPGDDMSGPDTPLCELLRDTSDFLDRPANQDRLVVRRRGGVFLGSEARLA